jgi:DNA-binding NarL/FixJ family response regulator
MTEQDSYEELCEIIGKSLAEKLSIDLGGVRIYFSQRKGLNADRNEELIRSIGLEAATELSFRWRELTFLVPIRGRLEARDRMICRLVESGWGARDIARLVGIGERSIQKIAAKGLAQLPVEGNLELVAPSCMMDCH